MKQLISIIVIFLFAIFFLENSFAQINADSLGFEAKGDSILQLNENIDNSLLAEIFFDKSFEAGNRSSAFLKKMSDNYLRIAQLKYFEAVNDKSKNNLAKFAASEKYFEKSIDSIKFPDYLSYFNAFTDEHNFEYALTIFIRLEDIYIKGNEVIYFPKSKELLNKVNDEKLYCKKYLYLGHINYYEENDDEAVKCYENVLNKFNCKDESGIAKTSLEQLKKYKN